MSNVFVIKKSTLAARVEEARREWEEMDTSMTSFEMRKRAETRYLSLARLARAYGVKA